MKKLTLGVAALFFSLGVAAQTNYYVSATGNNANDGLTTGTAVATLSNALSKSSDGDIINIDGDGGTLTQSSQLNVNKSVTFQGINDAILEGWTHTAGARMFNLNTDEKTIAFKDLTIQKMKKTAASGNSHGAVFNMEKKKDTLTLENVIVLESGTLNKNGGVLNISGDSCQVTINKCYFDGENAPQGLQGAGVYINNATSALKVVNSTLRKFSATNKGSAVMVNNASVFTGVNITVADNECTNTNIVSAGIHFQALDASEGTSVLQNSILINNSLPNASIPLLDLAAASGAYDLEVSNCLMGRINNNARTNILLVAPSNAATNSYGDEAGGGSPSIDGFTFNATSDVYEFDGGAVAHGYGDSSLLTAVSSLEDQLGATRYGTGGEVDAGAYEQATSYYVATGGDDGANDGYSTGAPFLTLSKAFTEATDGDIINIDGNGGILYQTSQLGISKSVTVQGINNAIVEGWTGSGPRMFNFSTANRTVTFKDMTIQKMTNTANGCVFNLEAAAGTNLTLENLKVLECGGNDTNGGVVNIVGSADNSDVTINKCYFDGTSAPVGNQGGAIFVNNATSDITIINSTIRAFSVDSKGAAIMINNAAVFKGVNLTIADNTCSNAAIVPAGIQFEALDSGAGTSVLQNSIVIDNTIPNASQPEMDIHTGASAYHVEISNSLIGRVSNNTRDNVLNDATNGDNASANNTYGNEAGTGSPDITGWSFNATTDVYEVALGALSLDYGDASFLTVLEDQLGQTRLGTNGNVDAGSYESPSTLAQTEIPVTSEETISLYPNPVKSTATISVPGATSGSVAIFSISGQQVAEISLENGQAEINVQNLQSGIYFAIISAGGERITKKFIVAQ